MARVCKRIAGIALSLALAFSGAAGAESEISYGDRGNVVRAMQGRLQELGFFSGDVDGIFWR